MEQTVAPGTRPDASCASRTLPMRHRHTVASRRRPCEDAATSTSLPGRRPSSRPGSNAVQIHKGRVAGHPGSTALTLQRPYHLAPRPGFEPGTYRLTAGRSTVELSGTVRTRKEYQMACACCTAPIVPHSFHERRRRIAGPGLAYAQPESVRTALALHFADISCPPHGAAVTLRRVLPPGSPDVVRNRGA